MNSKPPRPLPFDAPRLGPRGLAIFIAVMILTPFAIVVGAYALFPDVVPQPLPVRVDIEGYIEPARVAASVERYRAGEGEVLEPYISVVNTADFPLNSVYVTLNEKFVFHTSEPIGPGEARDFYLSRFQEHDGSRFWPNRYDLREVTVRGRLPSLEQAIFRTEWKELIDPPAADGAAGDAADGANREEEAAQADRGSEAATDSASPSATPDGSSSPATEPATVESSGVDRTSDGENR
ncbi:MAG TPA: hypothetical protein DCQ98_22165 [Planctomycetaceae bacterium]|nr:hypothetical protein [Planctomycetaceae bacterium]HRE99242.1 hypothetical protein [Pirellulaceae bacterium]